MSGKESKSTVPVATRITRKTHSTICKKRVGAAYLNIADYLRDLIRKDLEKEP